MTLGMKRIIVSAALFSAGLALTACGSSSPAPSAAPTGGPASSPIAAPSHAPSATAGAGTSLPVAAECPSAKSPSTMMTLRHLTATPVVLETLTSGPGGAVGGGKLGPDTDPEVPVSPYVHGAKGGPPVADDVVQTVLESQGAHLTASSTELRIHGVPRVPPTANHSSQNAMFVVYAVRHQATGTFTARTCDSSGNYVRVHGTYRTYERVSPKLKVVSCADHAATGVAAEARRLGCR